MDSDLECGHHPEEIRYICSCQEFICERCRGFHEQLHEAKGDNFKLNDLEKTRNSQCENIKSYITSFNKDLQKVKSYREELKSSNIYQDGVKIIREARDEIKKVVSAFFKLVEQEFLERGQLAKEEYDRNLENMEKKYEIGIKAYEDLRKGLEDGRKISRWQKTLQVVLQMDLKEQLHSLKEEFQQSTKEKLFIVVRDSHDYILEELHRYIHIEGEGQSKSDQDETVADKSPSQKSPTKLKPGEKFAEKAREEEPQLNELAKRSGINPKLTINPKLSTAKSSVVSNKAENIDFQITLPDYFDQPNSAKILHYFEGGSKNFNFISLDDLNAGTGKWKKIALDSKVEIPLRHRSLITNTGDIFISGGTKNNKEVASIFNYNIKTNTISSRSPMLVPRKSHGFCYLDGFLYVIGGYNSQAGALNVCERYNIKKDEWGEINSMTYAASSPSVCTFRDRFIFKFGGLTTDGKLSGQIEKYDIERDQWYNYELKENIEAFVSSGVQILWLSASCQLNENNILVFGGCDSENYGSDQSFLLEILQEDSSSKQIYKIKKANTKLLPVPGGFWNSQSVLHSGKLYCLQNMNLESDPKTAYENKRNILSFDSKSWRKIDLDKL